MIIKQNEKDVELKTISISAKCSDMCFCKLIGDKGQRLIDNHGYAPGFLSSNGQYGDYISFEIDVDTGKIKGWDDIKDSIQEYVDGDVDGDVDVGGEVDEDDL